MAQSSFDGNGSIVTNPHDSGNIVSLIAVDLSLNIHDDPVIIRLRTTNTEVSKRKLERALMGKKIFIQNQIGSFIRTSGEINSGLENWEADTDISQVTSSFIQSTDLKDTRFLEWEDAEWQYLSNALRYMESSSHTIPVQEKKSVSDKVHSLIKFLGSCHECTTGIIFVKE